MVSNSVPPESRFKWPRVTMVAIAAAIALGGVSVWILRPYASNNAKSGVPSAPIEVKTVSALGRLEPQGELVQLSAPSSAEGNRIAQLLVKEGEAVSTGQVIAVLDSRDRLQADLLTAQQQVRVAEAELARVKAGAKQGELAAQRAEIARLDAQRQGEMTTQSATIARHRAEVDNALAEFNRYQSLYQQGAISASERDQKQLVLQTAQRSLQEAQAVANRLQAVQSPELVSARARLSQIAEVRPVDVQVAQANINQARASVKQAQARLDQAYVKAPRSGVVLDIYAHPGEVVGTDGIAELGQTQQMYAVAEVYQSDVHKIKMGQAVKVNSDALPQSLTGKVDRISTKVRRQNIINTDPSENIDARVVEVYIKLDNGSSQQAAQFTNLQVNVKVQL
ncbi:ABC exporter membrane fusion protein [Acaryochloris marina]|uniref:ABC exporter membrane fusion protein n=1 Tax=Acaryochloris marina TaxID=155978 RepID=UPI001BAE6D60|nr:ABC exporter membrane fusion protein [Acaryochloris marina]QUY45262.1 ABC exporter membrane fusion protein [Acaryochloris marina S15]